MVRSWRERLAILVPPAGNSTIPGGSGTMSEPVMVIVADLDDAKHGEINVVESTQKAARLVETLLEAGVDQGRIRVFSGGEMDMRVRHRPVVAIVSGNEAAANVETEEEVAAEQPVTSGAQAEARKERTEERRGG